MCTVGVIISSTNTYSYDPIHDLRLITQCVQSSLFNHCHQFLPAQKYDTANIQLIAQYKYTEIICQTFVRMSNAFILMTSTLNFFPKYSLTEIRRILNSHPFIRLNPLGTDGDWRCHQIIISLVLFLPKSLPCVLFHKFERVG